MRQCRKGRIQLVLLSGRAHSVFNLVNYYAVNTEFLLHVRVCVSGGLVRPLQVTDNDAFKVCCFLFYFIHHSIFCFFSVRLRRRGVRGEWGHKGKKKTRWWNSLKREVKHIEEGERIDGCLNKRQVGVRRGATGWMIHRDRRILLVNDFWTFTLPFFCHPSPIYSYSLS